MLQKLLFYLNMLQKYITLSLMHLLGRYIYKLDICNSENARTE